jgi:hypothetical protein
LKAKISLVVCRRRPPQSAIRDFEQPPKCQGDRQSNNQANPNIGNGRFRNSNGWKCEIGNLKSYPAAYDVKPRDSKYPPAPRFFENLSNSEFGHK